VTRALVVLLLLGALGGCYTMRADVPGVMREDVDDAVVVGTFDARITRMYLLGGLVDPARDDDAFAAAMLEAARAQHADGVANLVFESGFSPGDFALNLLSCGVVSPRTYRLRGDLVRIEGAAVPGGPVVDAAPTGARP
jgi:hypothetical protein